MDRRIIAITLTLLICTSTAWGRMNALVVGGVQQLSATTATSGCVGLSSSGSSGSVEVIVYNSSGTLLAKTSSIDANTGGSRCANLDTSVSSVDGDLYLAVREISGTGYPRYRMLSGTSGLKRVVDQTSTPSTLPTGEIYPNNRSDLEIWLRDSGNNMVIGNNSSDGDEYTNPNHFYWRGTVYEW